MPNIFDVLINPNRFFEEKSKEEVSLRIPFVIVLIVGIIAAISGYFSSTATMRIIQVPDEAAPFLVVGTIIGVFFALLATFIFWLIYAAAFHGISILLNGKGEFKRTFEFTGYGFIPSIFSGVISLLATIFYVVPAISKIEFSTENPALLQQSIQQAILANPAMVAVSILGVLFTIWSANIWIFGMKHARNLSVRDSLISVGIPVGIIIVLTIYPLISAM